MPGLVSIVIPCLNAGPMLVRCLESCARQTYAPIEIVFVDNGSTDGSVETAQAFAASGRAPMVVAGCAQRGACAARNVGFERARGDFVQWLDADDEIAPKKIERQVAALEPATEADVAYGDWTFLIHAPSGGVTVRPRPERHVDDALCPLLLDRWRTPNAYLVRRRLAERLHAIQAFHPATPVAQDREYFTLAAIHSPRFVYVPDAVAIHNDWSPAQVSRSRSRAQRAATLRRVFARFREHADGQPPGTITAVHRELLEQTWDLYTAPRMAYRQDSGMHVALGASGEETPVSPLEALALAALPPNAEPSDVEGLAFLVAESPAFARASAQTSGLIDPALELHRTLRGLAQRGVLRRARDAELAVARSEAHATILQSTGRAR